MILDLDPLGHIYPSCTWLYFCGFVVQVEELEDWGEDGDPGSKAATDAPLQSVYHLYDIVQEKVINWLVSCPPDIK